MNERYLALDVGDKRIGIAVSDTLGLMAQPVGKIESVGWGPDIQKILTYCKQYQTNQLIVGLPLLMDGTCGEQAQKVKRFAEQLEKAALTITFWDERMTSVVAERLLIEAGMRREARKNVVDKIAATIILQAYLDAKKANEQSG